MKPSKLFLVIILFLFTTTFGQTTEKETPQTFKYSVTLIYCYQDCRSEQKVVDCPLKDDECLLLNGAEDVNTVFTLVDKILKDVLPESKRGKRLENFLPIHSGGSARRYDLYEHVKISIGVARHPKPHLGWIVITWQELESILKEKQ